MKTETSSSPSIVGILRDLREDGATLLHQEIELAKAEMSEKAAELVENAVQLSIGGFVAYAGAIIVLLGIADLVATGFVHLGLGQNISMWLARTLIGLIVAAVGFVMVTRAKKTFTESVLMPEKTISSVKENSAWAEHKIETAAHEATAH